MGKRGKDKRTEENLRKFHDLINYFIHHERLKYIEINGIKTRYIISSHGIVYSTNEKTSEISIIRPFMDKDAHLRVLLHVNGMKYKKFIHRLVAEAFIVNDENKPIVHHINGDTLNNDIDNLLWVTKEEHDFLTNELNQYHGLRGKENSSATCTDEQIEMALKLMSENEKYPDEICKECNITYSIFQHLRYRDTSWDYLKSKYDISNYNKFRRMKYTLEQKENFVKIRKSHPEYSLKDISKLMNINYTTIKNWNNVYIKNNA